MVNSVNTNSEVCSSSWLCVVVGRVAKDEYRRKEENRGKEEKEVFLLNSTIEIIGFGIKQ